MSFSKTFLMGIIFLCCSCIRQSESISPLVKTQSLADLQREALINTAAQAGNAELSTAAQSSLEYSPDPSLYYLNIRYNVKDLDVFETAGIPNSFEQIGHSFLTGIAKWLLSISGPKDINIDPIDFNIPELSINFNMVKSIQVKSIVFQYSQSVELQNDYNANFSFIDSLDFAREINVPRLGQVDSLYFSYIKSQNKCLNKCLNFNIINGDILDLVKQKSPVRFKPLLRIVSFPSVTDLKLDGTIELRIGIKLPF